MNTHDYEIYEIGDVVRNISSKKLTWTITGIGHDDNEPSLLLTNNQTGENKHVRLSVMEKYWVHHHAFSRTVKEWGPKTGWVTRKIGGEE